LVVPVGLDPPELDERMRHGQLRGPVTAPVVPGHDRIAEGRIMAREERQEDFLVLDRDRDA
jgi:hypothetical protein